MLFDSLRSAHRLGDPCGRGGAGWLSLAVLHANAATRAVVAGLFLPLTPRTEAPCGALCGSAVYGQRLCGRLERLPVGYTFLDCEHTFASRVSVVSTMIFGSWRGCVACAVALSVVGGASRVCYIFWCERVVARLLCSRVVGVHISRMRLRF